MNIEQLHYIAEVAKTGSLTKAAEHCHLTVTGVSRAITMFEQELGTRIFVRSRAGATVTAAGEKIIAKIVTILGQIDELKREASSYHELNNSRLRIASIPGPISLLIETLSDIKREFPGSRFELIEDHTAAVLDSVMNGNSDIGFVLLPKQRVLQPELHFERIVEDQLILLCHTESPLAERKTVQLQELTGTPLVLYNDPNILTLVQRLVPNSDILFKSNNVDALLRAVRANLAATIGTTYSLQTYGKAFNKEMMSIPLQLPDQGETFLWLVTAAGVSASRATELFIRRFRHALQVQQQPL
ncbi:LysR family transcriptional regulator [Paenibacillus campi]|uniref:LysR family transcriptional regulator n=1 Tax=Paenibacillus campi TaxID=3106031 RepID=UPI002AFEBE26|nr:LysR family transcriptional regulator [Paenibacillus sp. SGZ-1009]